MKRYLLIAATVVGVAAIAALIVPLWTMTAGVPEASTRSGRRPRVLVLGATGMLGHKLVQRLRAHAVPVTGTIRTPAIPNTPAARAALGSADRILTDVDVLDDRALAGAVDTAEPDVVINAIGVIKQLDAAKDPIMSIEINSLLPHRIANLCAKRGARLIHLSTDCVFAGRSGPYNEAAPTDAEDLYGRSKLLGEAAGSGCLTIRSSIVGRELRGRSSLIEWFLSQRGGKATGYAGALYTGLTTNTMADLMATLVRNEPDLSGVWDFSTRVESTDYAPYQGMRFGYRLSLQQEGSQVTGQGASGRRRSRSRG